MPASYGEWEAVVGLEVHAQLLTKTKLFCSCETSFGDEANIHTCPVCLGLPGALPVLNATAVRFAVRAALALGCNIASRSVFARKNYFYPDLPKGYQISQYEEPLAHEGGLAISPERFVRLTRIHMEEDAGKSTHAGSSSLVDLNRAGTPLIEIVSEPDLRSGEEASEYLRRLRDVLMSVRVNDGNLEQGSFRCDANVSVRKRGSEKLGTRAELKNINSFRFVEEAIDVEARRQIALLESNTPVRQETRGYNSEKKTSYSLRDKENDAGYRYFPDPDLPELRLSEELLDTIRGELPELPEARRVRYETELGLSAYAAGVLSAHPSIGEYFDTCVKLLGSNTADVVKAGNFLQTEVLSGARIHGLDASFPISPEQLVGILELVRDGTISGKQAKELYGKLVGTSRPAREVAKEANLAVVGDAGLIEEQARAILDANPKQVASYRAGKTNLFGFFVGQIMKATKGSADPAIVNEVVKRLLEAQ